MKFRIFALAAIMFLGFATLFVACNSSTPNTPAPGASAPTPTFTFTQVCNLGTSPTCTPIGTVCANTPVPTATVATTDYATGTVSYTGTLHAGAVNSTNSLVVLATGSSNFSGGNFIFSHVTTNGGTYRINSPAPGTGYFLAIYDFWGLGNYSGFPVGSPYSIAGGANSGCDSPGTGTAISGATVGPNFSFGDTCKIPGFYGTATYTGNRGIVGGCRGIYFKTFTDSAYTSATGDSANITTNGARYDLTTFAGGATTPVYLGAFFDVNGNGNADTGDAYIQLGLLTPSTAGTLVNITFSDANLIP